MEAANNGNYQRVEVIAKLFDLTVRRIQQLTQDGVLSTVETGNGRRYDLIPTIQAYIRYLSDKAYGKSYSDKELKLRQAKLEAEVALKDSQAELHKMKREIAAGKYIERDEVELDYQKFFIVFKRFALSLPSRLVSMISDSISPMEARRAERELSEEVAKILTRFSVAGYIEERKEEEGTADGKAEDEVKGEEETRESSAD